MTEKSVLKFAEELGLPVSPEDMALLDFLLALDLETEALGTQLIHGSNLEQRVQCSAALTAGDIAREGLVAFKNGQVLEAYRCLAQVLPHYRNSFSAKDRKERSNLLTGSIPALGPPKHLNNEDKRREALELRRQIKAIQSENPELDTTKAIRVFRKLDPYDADPNDSEHRTLRRRLDRGEAIFAEDLEHAHSSTSNYEMLTSFAKAVEEVQTANPNMSLRECFAEVLEVDVDNLSDADLSVCEHSADLAKALDNGQ